MPFPGFLRTLGPARWPLLLGFGLCFLGTFAIFAAMGHRSGPQPIAFNHARHIENSITCTDCHAGAQSQEHATLPTLATCMTCHESALTQSAEEEKIRTLAKQGKELVWIQLTRVPAHVYFSHRRHVQLAGLDCATCHGPVEKAKVPPRQPFRLMTMNTCIQCHEKSRARTDCNDCHR